VTTVENANQALHPAVMAVDCRDTGTPVCLLEHIRE
jgi:hypothetical protein